MITQNNPDFSDDMKQPNDKNSRYCTRCTRALKACLCEYIVPLENRTPLYILQHPYEVAHPKGTAALLAASMQQAEIRVGEDFSGDTWLNDLLADPSLRCYLLWPDEEAISPVELRQQMESVSSGAIAVAFILLDGTWRKAYRMLQSNPALARLPRIGLGAIAGQYAIRKKPFPEALSTIEAGYHLLSQWEGEPERYAPLLTLFEQLITQWQAFAEGRRT